MKLPNMNNWSCGRASCTSGANAAADITPPAVPNPAPQQMSTAAKAVERPGNSRPKWIGGLTIPKGKDVPKLGLVGLRQLDKLRITKRMDVSYPMTPTVFVTALRINKILATIGEDLKNDIEKVLAVYDDEHSNTQQTEAANREFLRLYAPLLKKNSYTTFENQAFRNLMRNVAREISKKPDPINAPSTSHPPVSIASTSLVAPPGRRLDFDATNLAFQIISAASAQNLLADQPTARVTSPSPVPAQSTPAAVDDLVESVPAPSESVQKSVLRRKVERAAQSARSVLTGLTRLRELNFSNLPTLLANEVPRRRRAVQTPSNLPPSAQSPDEQRRRAEEAHRQAVSDMRRGNELFRTWLNRNNIAVASNSGIGLNCLAVSLQQHATGEYGTDYERLFSTQADLMRQELGIVPGMLYSDDFPASRIIDWINRNYGTNMVLVEVQANDLGLPVITTPPEQIPVEGDKVVIWQQGIHFEALYAKAPQPASS